MIMLNLFIGVIMTGMGDAQREQDEDQEPAGGVPELEESIAALRASLVSVQAAVQHLQEGLPEADESLPPTRGGDTPASVRSSRLLFR
jgi:hypothetical protein